MSCDDMKECGNTADVQGVTHVAVSTVIASAHLIPLFAAFDGIWRGGCSYYYQRTLGLNREAHGLPEAPQMPILPVCGHEEELEDVPILVECMRDMDIVERRLKKGLKTIVLTERWFKTPLGLARLLHPRFFRMAWRFVQLLRDRNCCYFGIGIDALGDVARLCELFGGNPSALFRSVHMLVEKTPCGGASPTCDSLRRWYHDRLRLWGYFVAPSVRDVERPVVVLNDSPVRILWVGRMIGWKRIDTIVKALQILDQPQRYRLTLVGNGPERKNLERLASGMNNVEFLDFVSLDEVRRLMRENDVFVLSSNGEEGWGATASEALVEGMCVYGTFEAGSTQSMLPDDRLYHAGDYRRLAELLSRPVRYCEIGPWSVDGAATALKTWLGEWLHKDDHDGI